VISRAVGAAYLAVADAARQQHRRTPSGPTCSVSYSPPGRWRSCPPSPTSGQDGFPMRRCGGTCPMASCATRWSCTAGYGPRVVRPRRAPVRRGTDMAPRALRQLGVLGDPVRFLVPGRSDTRSLGPPRRRPHQGRDDGSRKPIRQLAETS